MKKLLYLSLIILSTSTCLFATPEEDLEEALRPYFRSLDLARKYTHPHAPYSYEDDELSNWERRWGHTFDFSNERDKKEATVLHQALAIYFQANLSVLFESKSAIRNADGNYFNADYQTLNDKYEAVRLFSNNLCNSLDGILASPMVLHALYPDEFPAPAEEEEEEEEGGGRAAAPAAAARQI